MQQIIPTLWRNNDAQEMVDYYVQIFPKSKILQTNYYTEVGYELHRHEPGEVQDILFEIEGVKFSAINGGPAFTDSTAISFYYRCNQKDKVQAIWDVISQNGEVITPMGEYSYSDSYGCAKDAFGVIWHVIHADETVDQKIVPALLFAGELSGKAEQAMRYYASIFSDSEVGVISPREIGSNGGDYNSVVYGEFMLLGQHFIAKDGLRNSKMKFSEDVSLLVECESQEQIDEYWSRLSADPKAEICGWLKDKYGVSWQIVPSVLREMMRDGSKKQQKNITTAYLKMKKFNIRALERAYNN